MLSIWKYSCLKHKLPKCDFHQIRKVNVDNNPNAAAAAIKIIVNSGSHALVRSLKYWPCVRWGDWWVVETNLCWRRAVLRSGTLVGGSCKDPTCIPRTSSILFKSSKFWWPLYTSVIPTTIGEIFRYRSWRGSLIWPATGLRFILLML